MYRVFAHNKVMKKRKNKKILKELGENCVSANDCTGLYQKVDLDPEEVKKFHKMFNGIDGKNSIE